jgi:ribosomal protein S18 acetylase RimI-like enzyme
MLGPIYGNLAAHGWFYQSASLRSGKFFALIEQNEVYGLLARFNDGNCMVHAQPPERVMDFVPVLKTLEFHTLWMLGMDHAIAWQMNRRLDIDAKVVDHLLMAQPKLVQVPVTDISIQEISTDPFNKDYLEATCRLLEKCFQYLPSQRLMVQRMQERLREEHYYLAKYDGQWVGQAHVQAWTPHYAHIGGIATLPGYTGRGFARQLTGYLCAYVHHSGRIPTLTVRTNNVPALKLYRSLGFDTVGVVTVLDSFPDNGD